MADTHILQTQLDRYVRQDLYPFHMPGHKRRMEPAPGLPAAWDVTEVPGTDDLHDAAGILRDAMRRTAALWGADRTWYLVNGSTCGLLAGIRAMAPPGSEILCARNCHKAVFHAIELSGYRVHWILPVVDEEWGICGGIRADQVRRALGRHPSARAVILTSPTYEGLLSEVGEICRIAHAKGIPVLVDEAHGAHLMPMSESAGFPAGALSEGADLVVQSPHKTLPSLTQTALLHLQGGLVEAKRIEDQLDIFETSSPSYPLLSSLDGCTGILREKGPEMMQEWADRLGRFDLAVRPLKNLRILHRRPPGGEREYPGGRKEGDEGARLSDLPRDPGKILIDARPAGMTGKELAAVLRGRYRMETEYAQGTLVLVMTSPCDREDALDRLAEALLQIDADASAAACGRPPMQDLTAALSRIRPASFCTIAEAAAMAAEPVAPELAAGRVCAEYLCFYPPGIPFLAPGEIIRQDHARILAACVGDAGDGSGTPVYRHAPGRTILCLCE